MSEVLTRLEEWRTRALDLEGRLTSLSTMFDDACARAARVTAERDEARAARDVSNARDLERTQALVNMRERAERAERELAAYLGMGRHRAEACNGSSTSRPVAHPPPAASPGWPPCGGRGHVLDPVVACCDCDGVGRRRVYPSDDDQTCARAALVLAELMPHLEAFCNVRRLIDGSAGTTDPLIAAWTKAKESLQ